jgi:hypothetical protein
MDDHSGFQEDIDWLFDHVAQDVAEVQDLEVPGLCGVVPPMPLQHIELPQRAPLNVVVDRCNHTNEDRGTLEIESLLQDYCAELPYAEETSGSTEEAHVGWKMARKVWQAPDNDTSITSHSSASGNAMTAERTKRRPSESTVVTVEDGISVFYSTSGVGVQFKRRKKYGPERKEEVNAVRKVGACIRCKLQKKSVRIP